MPIDGITSRPLRSAAFRFALLLALVFAAGAFALLVAVQQQIGRYADDATNGRLKGESAILVGEYAQLGRSGLVDAIARHQSVGGDAQFSYLLADAHGARLAGTLPIDALHIGWGTVAEVEKAGEAVSQPGAETEDSTDAGLTTLGTQLPGGLRLVVATDNFDVQDLRQRLGRFTMLCGVGITLFALFGGYLSGRVFLRRLDRVNHVVDRLIEGERAERLPMIGFGPEFDALARNLNRMLDRNEAAMDALRQVSTDIAHDLRTPLTRLHQRLEQLQGASTAHPVILEDALAQTTGLLATFHALLRIGTVEGGVGRRHFRRVALSELMDRVHQAYQPVAEDAGHALIADHVAGVEIDGDDELLAQLFINLIDNALVHTPPGTVITSRLKLVGDVPVAEICDTGPGIPASEASHVFRRFYRLDASRNTEGAGLGLALVAAIASLHRAECRIPDTAEGLCVRLDFLTARGSPLPRQTRS